MPCEPVYAIVPTCGRSEVHRCAESLAPQVSLVVAVVNGGYLGDDLHASVLRVVDPGGPRNISRWWNLGLDAAARTHGSGPYSVLVVNDDVILGPGSVDVLVSRMRARSASLAFPADGPELLLSTPAGPRIAGWCFALPGEDALRADEAFTWWCGDNDLDHRARLSGRGSLAVPGVDVQHTDPNGYTNRIPELTVQAGLDLEAFRAKWGRSAV